MPVVLETGSVLAGDRISRLIGQGATGAVYLAEGADGQQVALKVLIPELALDGRFRERFLREAEIAAAVTGTIDGGGNRASGNAIPPQCLNVACTG